MAISTSNQDKVGTLAHLVNTAGHHISHALRHAEALKRSVTPQQREFNLDHLITHANGAAEHIQKIMNHLNDNYPAEAQELAKLEATIPVTGKPDSIEKRQAIIKKAAAIARNGA
jgi:hypothetical protein